MSRRALVMACLLAIALNGQAQSSSPFHKQEYDLHVLQRAVDDYLASQGYPPSTDGDSTWYQKLVAEGFLDSREIRVGFTPDRTLPIDIYGYPLKYDGTVVRAVGRNGRDDLGTMDDWDAFHEPAIGTWYKWNWPQLYRRVAQCSLAALVVAVGILWFLRPLQIAVGTALISVALIGAVWLPFGFSAGASTSHIPRWVDAVQLASFAGLLGGAALLTPAIVAKLSGRSRQRACKRCGYPIGQSRVCTECGHPVRIRRVSPR